MIDAKVADKKPKPERNSLQIKKKDKCFFMLDLDDSSDQESEISSQSDQ